MKVRITLDLDDEMLLAFGHRIGKKGKATRKEAWAAIITLVETYLSDVQDDYEKAMALEAEADEDGDQFEC
jgi:hypothetical protein